MKRSKVLTVVNSFTNNFHIVIYNFCIVLLFCDDYFTVKPFLKLFIENTEEGEKEKKAYKFQEERQVTFTRQFKTTRDRNQTEVGMDLRSATYESL